MILQQSKKRTSVKEFLTGDFCSNQVYEIIKETFLKTLLKSSIRRQRYTGLFLSVLKGSKPFSQRGAEGKEFFSCLLQVPKGLNLTLFKG